MQILYHPFVAGVEKVDANVEKKLVNVTVASSIEPETLVDALKKWSESSGKSVKLLVE